MRRKLRLAFSMILGSFLLYCAQDVTQRTFDDVLVADEDSAGPVSDAAADSHDAGPDTGGTTNDGPEQIVVATCCPPPERPEAEVLYDAVVPANAAGDVVQVVLDDVSPYRRLVLHANGCGWHTVEYKYGVSDWVGGPEQGLSLEGSTGNCDGKRALLANIDPDLGNAVRLRFQFQPVFDGPDGIAVTVVGRR